MARLEVMGQRTDNRDRKEVSYRKDISFEVLADQAATAGSEVSLLWLCLEAKPKNQYCCSFLALTAASHMPGRAISVPTKTRKRKDIFLVWLREDKYFVFVTFPTQHLLFYQILRMKAL